MLVLAIALFATWCFQRGYILYYGDAQSHLNLSRSIIDSRTPGYDQLGTVWLPVLHVICLPFVANDSLWNTGLAGTIPVALCFLIAGVCLYLAALNAYRSVVAAVVVIACFALNPNVLYLASIPMTEIVFLAGLAVLLLSLLRFRATQKLHFAWLGIAACWWVGLTRYDGWFLVPFAAIGFAMLSVCRRWLVFIVFGVMASLAPLYWIAHNWWETGNALDFYNGPYSPAAIQANRWYPGYHDWLLAARYYGKAGQLCSGWPLILLGVIGIVCAVKRKVFAPASFLFLSPLFYIWSIHSSSATPIFIPQLPPHGYYNSRYGIAVVVLAAFATGAIVLILPPHWRRCGLTLPIICGLPWLLQPTSQNWICWKESQVNSASRRAWTNAGAEFLHANYQPGQGILTPSASGDIAGIFCRARIPLRETINVGNGPAWFANISRPDLVHQALWAVAQAGDIVAQSVNGTTRREYTVVGEIQVKGAPALGMYRRK